MTDWVERYVALAEHVGQWSKDPHTRVGCVIVGEDRRDVAIGYNGFPPGVADDERMDDRELKRALTQHAERNALDNAKFSCRGATLVTTMHPCLECCKSVIGKGVGLVVCPAPVPREPWLTDAVCARALLDEVGVHLMTTPPVRGVRVTASAVLGDMWGAVDAWEFGGPEYVRKLVSEDQSAFLEEATWTIERRVP